MKLMPKKHIKYNDTIIGFSPIVYREWDNDKTINDNIEVLQRKYSKDVNDIVICLDFLYCLGKMDFVSEKGVVKNDFK